MSDYKTIDPGDTGLRQFTMCNKDGDPITSGSATYCLKALSGPNAGKWWLAVDEEWNEGQQNNNMTHQGGGHWTCSLPVSPFVDGVQYLEYALMPDNSSIPNGVKLTCVKSIATRLSEQLASIRDSNRVGLTFNDFVQVGTENNIHRVYVSDVRTGRMLESFEHETDNFGIIVRSNSGEVHSYHFEDGGIQDILEPGTYQAPSANKCRFKYVGDGWLEFQFLNSLYEEVKQLNVSFYGGGLDLDYAALPTLRIHVQPQLEGVLDDDSVEDLADELHANPKNVSISIN